MPIEFDVNDANAFHNAQRKYGTKFATGEFTAANRTDTVNEKMDLGIRDTLYKGEQYSESMMHRGEVLFMLDAMMNTKSYREEFKKTDPERFNVYQLAHKEFLGQNDDIYVSPEVAAPDTKKE